MELSKLLLFIRIATVFLLAASASLAIAQAPAAAGMLPTSFERLAAQGEQVALVKVLAADPYGADVEVVTPVKGTRGGEKLRVHMPGADIYCTPELDTAGTETQWMMARRKSALAGRNSAGGDGYETQLLRVAEGRVLLTPPEEKEKRYLTVAELVKNFGGAGASQGVLPASGSRQ